MGIIPAATQFDDKAQATPEKLADKRPSMFYSRIGKGVAKAQYDPAASSGADEEAVLIGLTSDQEALDPRVFKYDK